MKKSVLVSIVFAAIGGAQAFAQSTTQQHNVLVHFPPKSSDIAQKYEAILDGELAQKQIGGYTTDAQADGAVTFCVETEDAGNQYRVVEFSKNSVDGVDGAWAVVSFVACK